MSGSVAALAVGAASLAVDFLAGDQGISLGDFVFDRWEIPEKIEWGGGQRLTVHKMVGGDRVIDVMGRDDADITWSGIFLSPDASQRASQLDQMRIDGKLLELIFCGRLYKVVISQFHADQHKPWHVPYTITCTVLSDKSADNASGASMLAQVVSDVAAAAAFISDGMSLALTALAIVGALIDVTSSIETGSDQARAIEQAMADTMAQIQARQNEVSARVTALTAATAAGDPIAAAATIDEGIANLQDAAEAARDSALAAAMAAYVGRAARNVGEA